MNAMVRSIQAAVAVAFVAVLAAPVGGEPAGWRQDGTGRFPDATPPLEWAKDSNVRWKTKMPGPGFGSPVLVGDKLFVVSYPAEVLCVRASDGKVLWQESTTLADVLGKDKADEIAKQYERLDKQRNEAGGAFGKLRKEMKDAGLDPDKPKSLDEANKDKLDKAREKITQADRALREQQKKYPRKEARGEPGNAAATPACDGKHLAAVFGTGIVAVYTTEGKKLWARFVESPTIAFGHSASPVLAGDRLIVHLEDLVALDLATGKELWRTAVPARHASSILTRLDEQDVLVTPAGPVVRVRDGKVLNKGKFSVSESTPLLDGRIIYASNSGRVQAVKLSAAGEDEAKLEEVWKADAARDRRTPSSVLHDGLLYAVNTNGILDAIDVKSGEHLYSQRLPLNTVYASITLAGGHLFVMDMRGKAVVLKPGRRYQRVATNDLEGTGASPVFVGERLYLRGHQHLYCIEKGAKKDE
jgi:outer membrane protein assembly factor BamB